MDRIKEFELDPLRKTAEMKEALVLAGQYKLAAITPFAERHATR
jgi:hypothetical protein